MPLNPPNDGLVELFNLKLATQLAFFTSRHWQDWDRHLPLVLWAYQSEVQEDTGCTLATLMFGRKMQTPVDLALGTAPGTELPKTPVLEYLLDILQCLVVAHNFAQQHQEQEGAKQKWVYDTRG